MKDSAEDRYEAWAGTGWPRGWAGEIGFGSRSGVVWPIVDTETCGEIDGQPKPEQWCCIAFDANTQRLICDLLNNRNDSE